MSIKLVRINPNQTQVFFPDGRFETLTNEELNSFVSQIGDTEAESFESALFD